MKYIEGLGGKNSENDSSKSSSEASANWYSVRYDWYYLLDLNIISVDLTFLFHLIKRKCKRHNSFFSPLWNIRQNWRTLQKNIYERFRLAIRRKYSLVHNAHITMQVNPLQGPPWDVTSLKTSSLPPKHKA